MNEVKYVTVTMLPTKIWIENGFGGETNEHDYHAIATEAGD